MRILSKTDQLKHNSVSSNRSISDDAGISEKALLGRFFLANVRLKYIVGFTILLIILAVGGSIATTTAMALLCVWALFGASQAIRALSLGVTIKYLNIAVFSFSYEIGILAWLLLLLSAVRVLPYALNNIKAILPIIVFALLVGVTSLTASSWREISIMKLIAFSIGALAAITAFSAVEGKEVEKLRHWFFGLAATIIILSIPTFFFPHIAHARAAEAGFQGILNHPQAFGVFLAPFTAWFLSGILFRKVKIRPIELALVVGLVVLIMLTGARTALAATILGLAITFIVAVFVESKGKGWAKPYRAVVIGVVILFICMPAALMVPSVNNLVTGFIFKGDQDNKDNESVQAAFQASRGSAAKHQWENFLDKPLTGHGFGIYPHGMNADRVVRFMGIPISYPVEKGFLPTAILEETGIVGAAALLFLLITLARRVIRENDVRWTSFFFTCLSINIGEAVIFSVGGIGFYFWLLIGLAIARSGENAKKEINILPEQKVQPPNESIKWNIIPKGKVRV